MADKTVELQVGDVAIVCRRPTVRQVIEFYRLALKRGYVGASAWLVRQLLVYPQEVGRLIGAREAAALAGQLRLAAPQVMTFEERRDLSALHRRWAEMLKREAGDLPENEQAALIAFMVGAPRDEAAENHGISVERLDEIAAEIAERLDETIRTGGG